MADADTNTSFQYIPKEDVKEKVEEKKKPVDHNEIELEVKGSGN